MKRKIPTSTGLKCNTHFINLKLPVVILLSLTCTLSFGQCIDVFHNAVKCVSVDDSLLVYNNALRVYEYYENNKSYKKINSYEVWSESDRLKVFEKLKDARKTFFDIRREVSKIKGNSKKQPNVSDVSFGQYFQKVNNCKFYQRELENQIINLAAPITLYDTRISPVVVNEYKCTDTGSAHLGDIVNIPIYIPVTVKPVSMLTAEEMELRKKILHLTSEQHIAEKNPEVILDAELTNASEISDTLTGQQSGLVAQASLFKSTANTASDAVGAPVYYRNQYGGASIIGFMSNRKFTRIKPIQYKEYVVPKAVQELLEDNDRLTTWFKIHYGDYFLAIY